MAVAVAAFQLGVGGNGVLPSVLMVPRSTAQPHFTAAVAVSCLGADMLQADDSDGPKVKLGVEMDTHR